MQSTHKSSGIRELVISIFKLNGLLVETGNTLVVDIGLTTASWQVLGALGYSPVPLPVSHIARNMGLARQSVQRVVDVLAGKGMVRFEPNPHHQRAKFILLTAVGRAALEAAEKREGPLDERILDRIGAGRIKQAIAVLAELDGLLAAAVTADHQEENAA